jgi:hypothetical protein
MFAKTEAAMKTRSMVVVLSMLCIFLAWRLAARPQQQQQPQTPQNVLLGSSGALTLTDADIQLMRQDLRVQKQKLIAQNLPMTESEAVKFWAVYNRYSSDLRQINDEKYRLIRQYGDEWSAMTNEQALVYIRRWLEVDDQAHQLRSKYVVDVSQALPGKKAATFFQLDRRISMMIDLQLASQLPLAMEQDKP